MDAAADTLRWLAVDNPLAKSVWSGASQLIGYTSSHCSRQVTVLRLLGLGQEAIEWQVI